MVDYNDKEEQNSPLQGQKIKRRPMTEAYYEDAPKEKLKYKQPDQGKKKMSDKKPDASKHEGKNVFAETRKPKCPGQMYTQSEKDQHNESDFAGERKQKAMY